MIYWLGVLLALGLIAYGIFGGQEPEPEWMRELRERCEKMAKADRRGRERAGDWLKHLRAKPK